jgi:hypothetical protein
MNLLQETPESSTLATINGMIKRLAELESTLTMAYATGTVSNPPSASQLDALFGDPDTLSLPFVGIVEDLGNARRFIVWHNGTSWFSVAPGVGGGAGTVTSVGFTATPAGVFNVAGQPVTGAGVIALSMDNQSGNSVMASPAGGGSGQPAFRSLVNADMPVIQEDKGGTGLIAYTQGDLLYAIAVNSLAKLGIGAAGEVLTVVGGLPAWAAAATGTVTSVGIAATPASVFDVVGSPITGAGTITISLDQQTGNVVLASPAGGGLGDPAFRSLVNADMPVVQEDKGGTGQTGYTLGDVLYASALNTLAKLGIGSAGQVLTVVGGIPAWATNAPGAGASIALDNLAGVQINTSLISDTDNTDNLGSSAIKWLAVYQYKSIFEEGAAPATPAAGEVVIYAKADGLMYSKDDAGVETQMSGGAGGGGDDFVAWLGL